VPVPCGQCASSGSNASVSNAVAAMGTPPRHAGAMREFRAIASAAVSKSPTGCDARMRAAVIRPSASVSTSSVTRPAMRFVQASAGSGAAASRVVEGGRG